MPVQYDELVERIRERAGIAERGEAERTAVAVVQALCDRLTRKEGWDLLAQLPARLKTAAVLSPAQRISVGEFVHRVAEDLGVPEEEARQRIRAVFQTLREAVTLGEFDDVLAQLDPEYADLIA